MSVVPPLLPLLPRTFGGGGDEPYAAALRGSAQQVRLVPLGSSGTGGPPLAVARWTGSADATDRAVLADLAGPVLDVGCGPGRMVRAALDADLPALGIDVASAAVERCVASGLPVLRRSVFGRVPRAGSWGAVLLLDGNVGIGGDPAALLARCADLLRPGGSLLVEAHADPARAEVFAARLLDDAGRLSGTFPWAELGTTALAALAAEHGFRAERSWTDGGRAFVRLRREGVIVPG